MSDTFDAYTLTWDECKELNQKRKIVCDNGGWAINHNKLTEKELYRAWHEAVTYAMQGNKVVPEKVLDDYSRQPSPKERNIMADKFDEKPETAAPRFAWSYSALTQFENCPLAFAHQKYYKDVPFIESEAIKDGNRKHTALELYLKGKEQPKSELDLVKPYLKYADAFKAQEAQGAVLQAEREITLTAQLKPTSWFAKDAWFRCKIDVSILRGTAAFIYDWKTGKQKEDMTQLKLSCAALAIVEPETQEFTSKNIWLKTSTIDAGVKLARTDLREVWADILARVGRMKAAWDSEVWQPKPSGLCGYCAYAPQCKYRK